jgi:hypothetical protein
VKLMRQILLTSLVLVALASPRVAAAYDKSAFIAPEGEAFVVFIQNVRAHRSTSYVVFDANKACVAEVGGRQAEVVPMKPGKYTFYVAGFNNRRIDVHLAPGRTYFIRFYSEEKFATRVSDVTPVQRGTDSYKSLKNWLKGATVTHASDDPCRGKPLKESKKRTQKRLNDANSDWKKGDQLFRYKYMLLEEDGLTPDEIDRL